MRNDWEVDATVALVVTELRLIFTRQRHDAGAPATLAKDHKHPRHPELVEGVELPTRRASTSSA